MDNTERKACLPLSGVRVVELTFGKLEMCGRLLADMGAEVVLVEPAGGVASRFSPPLHNGVSLHFASHNANKRSVELDLETTDGVQQLGTLLGSAQIFIEGAAAGWLQQQGLDQYLRSDLVHLSISDFGRSGPYAGFTGSNPVMLAMGGVLARSGIKGEVPLLPPGGLAYESAAMQAAWVALSAYWAVLNGMPGGCFDFSVFEATLQILDPGMGVTGSATGGRSALEMAPRGRPPVGNGYPIFACADGAVRICLLNPRQWQGMSAWLGNDHPFTDPSYGNLAKRFKSIREINALIAELFRPHRAAELVEEGQRRGVPIASVASPGEVLSNPHFVERNSFADVLLEGRRGCMPAGFVEFDSEAAGVRMPAPGLGQDNGALLADPPVPCGSAGAAAVQRPFAGIRVLDLGVIVAGAELGRLLADLGAEVIKVENAAYPDGLRQSLNNQPMTISFAQGSRGKRSLGLNLRDPRGIELFKQLVATADVILSNFKPGTMESLGIGYEVLSAIKQDLIMADSSALGNSGPLSRSMGYGPLIRATTGLTWMWRYPEREDGYSDSTTTFPDHLVARVSASAIAAALIRRQRTGRGGCISVCQAETILGIFASEFLEESLQPGSLRPQGNQGRNDAPSNVFPCAGDDEWCVIDVGSDEHWQSLCAVLERSDWLADPRFMSGAGRLANAGELEQGVAEWTLRHSPLQVRDQLQAVGVPAGNMLRLDEMSRDPHLLARDFFRTLEQPGLDGPVLTENLPAHGPWPALQVRPAPFHGQHTREIARDILGLSVAAVDGLIADGVLETLDASLEGLLSSGHQAVPEARS